MASLLSEPLIFSCDDPSLLSQKIPQKITLLVNPETLTINWKKVITKTRTKSRIVSFYWGQEPISLTYNGQTGSLIPSKELIDAYNSNDADNLDSNLSAIDNVIVELERQRRSKELDITIVKNDPFALDIAQKELADIEQQLATARGASTVTNNQLQEKVHLTSSLLTTSSILSGLGDVSHTDIIKKSDKYQRFSYLRKFYEATQNVNILTKLLYRRWVFEGYFENFSFTDDAKSPWNWQYSLTFIILNWQETGPEGELLLVEDTV